MPRMSISYRVSLVIAIPTLVALVGGLVLFRAYAVSAEQAEALSVSLFGEVSLQAMKRIAQTFSNARRTCEMLRDLGRGGLLPQERAPLARGLAAVLRSNATFAGVGYGAADGSFSGAYRTTDGKLRVNMSWIANGRTHLEEHDVLPDGSWKTFRADDDYRYDPRERGWYQLGARSEEGAWTEPYVFLRLGIPGLSYVLPHRDERGQLLGVLDIDFDLNRLSEMVTRVSVGKEGTMFMFTSDGTLLGHPRVRSIEGRRRGEGKLLRISDVEDPVLSAYFEAAIARISSARFGDDGRTPLFPFTFRSEGGAYLGTAQAARVSSQMTIVVGTAVPRSSYLGVVTENLRRAALLALLLVLLGVLFAIWMAGAVSRPLLRVAREMDRLATFDLSLPVPQHSPFREIERMERSLKGMIHALRSFAAYVPRDQVRRLVTTGQVARLGGQARLLTLFFSDVAGFTSLTEKTAPDRLVQMLGDYLTEVVTLLSREGATIDKFIGDGVMAFWNAPEEQPDHALRALRAALAVQRRLAEIGDPALATRIGIATGEAIVGNFGTSERMNYTAVGDVVNLAARLEATNKQYGTRVLLSQATWELVRDHITCRPVDTVAVVGKEEAVRLWEPIEGDSAVERAALTTRALDAYAAGDLAGALALYRQLDRLLPGDPLARTMIARCEEYLVRGLPEGFTGTTRILQK